MTTPSYFVPGQWNFVCDLCGAEGKSGEAVKTWNGLYTCSHHKEVRNPQDFLRGVKDDQSVPWSRTNPLTGELYPNTPIGPGTPDGNGGTNPGGQALPGPIPPQLPPDDVEIFQFLNVRTAPIPRFTPKYFTVDGPRSMSFGLTTSDLTLQVDFVARVEGDLCGLIWSTDDLKDHKLLGYRSDGNYTNCVWTFTLDLSATMPVFNDPQKALSITVNAIDQNGQAVQYFIPIFRYCTNPSGRSGVVTIDWDTVKAGFFADQPIFVQNVKSLFIACITTGYVDQSLVPLPAPIQGRLQLSGINVSGLRSTIEQQLITVERHELGMSTSYDDHYDQSPQRILDNIDALGYAKQINHYCGMSVFPNKKWDATAGRFLIVTHDNVLGDPVVNPCAAIWHQNFAALCFARGITLIQAVSYETFSENARTEWVQRDFNGVLGFTGYTPPSYFMSPCIPGGMSWMKKAFQEFAGFASAAGLEVRMQVGEPWWWLQPGSNEYCCYDATTLSKFNAETGLFAPYLGKAPNNPNTTLAAAFKTFLKKELGLSVLSMRTATRALFPTAKVAALVFLPSILTPNAGAFQEVNLPVDQYKFPNLDFFQTEAYDWLIEGDLRSPVLAYTYASGVLGYPNDKIEYLAGFAPEFPVENRSTIWARIVGNIQANRKYGMKTQHVWAYSLLMRDSVTLIPAFTLRYYFFYLRIVRAIASP